MTEPTQTPDNEPLFSAVELTIIGEMLAEAIFFSDNPPELKQQPA